MKNYLGLIRAMLVWTIALLAMSSAQAAEWRPISLMVGAPPYTSYTSFVYRSSDFLDGAFTQAGQFLLSNNPNLSDPTYQGEKRTELSFNSSFGSAPIVSVAQHTIDVSSFWAEGKTADWGCNVDPNNCNPGNDKLVWRGVIGWPFGPTTPVSYVTNADGTFTATWTAPEPQNYYNGFNSQTVRFTFAAAVPEPKVTTTLAAGLALIMLRVRRRSSN